MNELEKEAKDLREGGRKMEFRLEHWLLLVAALLAFAAAGWIYLKFHH